MKSYACFLCLFFVLERSRQSHAFATWSILSLRQVERRIQVRLASSDDEFYYSEYDVVEFLLREDDEATGVGVVLANGKIQPLCVWSEGGKEFVWDEDAETIEDTDRIVRIIDDVWPTTRLVDGGLGPNNPHGEESEDVFVIEPNALSSSTAVVVKTDREIFW